METKFQVMRFYFNTALFDEVRRDKSGKLPIHQVGETNWPSSF